MLDLGIRSMSSPVFSYTVIDAMQLRLCMLNATAPYPLGMESWIPSLVFTFRHRRLEENPAIETCQALSHRQYTKTALLNSSRRILVLGYVRSTVFLHIQRQA